MTVSPSVGAQLHFKGILFAGSETVMVALAGQTISGIETVGIADCPGSNEPLDGVMEIPLTPLLDAVQVQLVWLLGSALTVKGQLQPEPVV